MRAELQCRENDKSPWQVLSTVMWPAGDHASAMSERQDAMRMLEEHMQNWRTNYAQFFSYGFRIVRPRGWR